MQARKKRMNRNRVGYYSSSGRYDFFTMLPPDKWDSPLSIDEEMIELEKNAIANIESRNNIVLFNAQLLHKVTNLEAIESCAIEGIKEDSQFIKNYILALQHIEISSELDEDSLLRCFNLLMMQQAPKDGTVFYVDVGSYRNTLVQVGNLMPAPYWDVPHLMKELFEFMYSSRMNILVKAAIVHVWFETIHPFNDGNGRMGRVLIIWMLLKSGLSDDLIECICVSPSVYFNGHRQEYYDRLDKVRTDGDIEGWIKFFLKAFVQE